MGKNKRARPDDDSFASTMTTSKLEEIIEKLVPVITDKIMASVLSVLQPLVQDLRDRVKHLEDQLSSRNQENPEEKDRLRAVVISGLNETGAKPTERRANDINSVNQLIDELNVDATPVQVFRMGRPSMASSEGANGNLLLKKRPRLLKVIFQTTGQQREMVKSARQIKDSAIFKGVFIRPSLTAEQRKIEFELREELKSRRANGESVGLRGWPGESNREIVSFNNTVYNLSSGNGD